MTKSNNNKGNSQQGSKPAKTSTTYIKNDSSSTVNFNKQGSITTKGVSVTNSKKD